jgi:3-(3-hydroxy-phenyl)propionate hydroxylase
MDAPVTVNGRAGWFLQLLGDRFHGVYFAAAGESMNIRGALATLPVPVQLLVVRPPDGTAGKGEVVDAQGLLATHYDATPGSFYLIRPDQHVAARWRTFAADAVHAALDRCLCVQK